MSRNEDDLEPKFYHERHALRIALWLNIGLAASLGGAGVIGDSSGLLANALDNASDAAVYAISYYAVDRGPKRKARAAQLSGVMLLVLCVGVLVDVARRFISGAEPVGVVMMVMTVVAAIINVVCLKLLYRHRHGDVNLRAAWTFSTNDLLSNLGVLVAGILVAWLGVVWPDLVIGIAIALIAAKGSIEILLDARRTSRGERDRANAVGNDEASTEGS